MTALVRVVRGAAKAVLSQHVTVKIIPESAQEAVSFRVSVLVLLFAGLMTCGLAGGVVYLHLSSQDGTAHIQDQRSDLQVLQANLDEALTELQGLLRSVRPLDEELEGTFTRFGGAASHESAPAAMSRSQFTDFFRGTAGVPEDRPVALREVEELRSFVDTLGSSLAGLSQTREVLSSLESHLRHVPHHWPVANGGGVVTMEFGPNLHPFTGQWYLHKGFDVAGPVGLPLVAAADGVVVDSSYDLGYGNNVIIRHRYGFYTRYAHLHTIHVREGQRVSQGQQIGTLGSSGMSSGPHVHMEVIVGGEVLDPAPFLKISNTFPRGGTGSVRRR